MDMLFHASPVKNLQVLKPFVSNHGVPMVYFSAKRENVLVYLSNAVEKYCRESGFKYDGIWYKWASYGFDAQGRLQIEEYYPNALYDTYKGVSGYLYKVKCGTFANPIEGIQDAYTAAVPVKVWDCEYIEDAYEAILEAQHMELISILRYEELSEGQLNWLERVIPQEYDHSENHPEYRHFLKGKFPELLKDR